LPGGTEDNHDKSEKDWSADHVTMVQTILLWLLERVAEGRFSDWYNVLVVAWCEGDKQIY